jgi:hypothetical protein
MSQKRTRTLPYAKERLSDEQLKTALGVPQDFPVLKGIREVAYRLEEALLEDAATQGLKPLERLGALERYGALEDVLKVVEQWRASSDTAPKQ